MSDPSRYRIEKVAPSIAWCSGRCPGLEAAVVPYVPDGWTAWACLMDAHRYHRTRQAAADCAGLLAPRREHVQISESSRRTDPFGCAQDGRLDG